LITKKATEHNKVIPIYFRKPSRLFIFKDAQLISTVILEIIRINVFKVPRGIFNGRWCHAPGSAPTRSKMYEENNAPKSMTSEARNNQIPTLALYSPVSGLGVEL
jgi:hypothetical protein